MAHTASREPRPRAPAGAGAGAPRRDERRRRAVVDDPLVEGDDLARRAAEWGGVVVESIVSEPHASASPEGQAVFVLLMTKNPQWGKSKCKWVDGKSIVYQDKVQIDPPFQAENCSSLDGDEDTCNMVARWLASSTKKRARRENRFDLAEKNSFVVAGP